MVDENRYFGKSILVVEDDYFLAQQVIDWLEGFGAIVIGPARSVARAMDFAKGKTHIDGAILDINLDGEMAFPVADLLLSQGVPFVFATGFGEKDIPGQYASVPRLFKPVDGDDLQGALFGDRT